MLGMDSPITCRQVTCSDRAVTAYVFVGRPDVPVCRPHLDTLAAGEPYTLLDDGRLEIRPRGAVQG